MVIIVAGQRIDAEDAEQERFPLKNADSVAEAVRSKFEALRPGCWCVPPPAALI